MRLALFQIGLCVWIHLSALALTSAAQGLPAEPKLTPQQQERLKERDRLAKEASRLSDAGKLDEAVATVETALAIEREVLAPDHPDLPNTLSYLAGLHERLEDFSAAHKERDEALAMLVKLLGKENWQVTDARLAIDHLARLQRLDRRERQQLAEAERLHRQAAELQAAGKYREALAPALQVVEIQRSVLGDHHRDYAVGLFNLAQLYERLDEYAKAEPLYQQARLIEKSVLGESHPSYAVGLTNLARLYRSMGSFDKAVPLLQEAIRIQKAALGDDDSDYATSVYNLATLYESQAAYAKAEPLFLEALKIRKAVLGEKSPFYAQNLDGLAGLYIAKGEFTKAEPLMREGMEIYRKAYGEKHPYYASCLANLGRLYSQMGEFPKAESLLQQALAIRKAALGETNPTYAVSLKDLGFLYNRLGDAAKAEALYRQAADIEKATLGEKHPHYATSLGNLGATYAKTGDYVRAEPIYRTVLELTKETFGEKHPRYAIDLSQLAALYTSMGDYIKAEPLLRQALQIRKEALGERHPDYAESLNDMALVCQQMKAYSQAESLFQQALAVKRQTLGEKHPEYALTLNNLGVFYETTGEYVKAEALLLEAADRLKQEVKENHPYRVANLACQGFLYCSTGKLEKAESIYRDALRITKTTPALEQQYYPGILNNLAEVYQRSGAYAKGVPLCREALEYGRRQLERTAAVQSERQQLAMRLTVWGYLDRLLYLSGKAGTPAEDVYSDVLSWKGEVGARQQRLRALHHRLRESGRPEVVKLDAELSAATQSLAALSRAGGAVTDGQSAQWETLNSRVEKLQRQLASASADFRKDLDQERRSPADIRKALPVDTTLVDFLTYQVSTPPKYKGEQERIERFLTAFVVRRDRPIERVEFGAIEPIEAAVLAWRRQFGQSTPHSDPGADLRRLVWQPLEGHLAQAKVLLVSPNDIMAQLPWGALPGKQPGTFLIDELAIGMAPISRLLPDLLAAELPAQEESRRPSLLLVGDVDFDADPGKLHVDPSPVNFVALDRSAPSGGEPMHWSSLPGTRDEVAAIRDSFLKRFTDAQAKQLSSDRATKSAVRAAVGNYRYVHFSTHGFFAPPGEKAAVAATHGDTGAGRMLTDQTVTGYQPGLLSGLVLAGANRRREDDKEDGILTALEVAEMDLSDVQLATLSACETGLGKSAGGEGLLGLQRAFQTAGAKTVVASLWKVPDRATQLLMARFYDNLWRKRMSKLEALREAQLWLLHAGPKNPDLVRGLEFTADEPIADADAKTLPPYYWAAFVLSGDWR